MRISDSELKRLTVAMEDKNLSFSQVLEFIENSDLQSEKTIDVVNEIKLTVDYGKTLEQAIADGNYDWKNDVITAKNFPISPEMIGKKVEVVTKLFYFNRDISSNDGISEMEKADYRPATLMELLALGAVLVTLVACLFWSSVALGVGFASLGLFMTGAFIVFSLVSASEIKKPVSK